MSCLVLAACLLSGSPDTLSPLYRYDASALNQLDLNNPEWARKAWDTLHVLASAQGIVNREGPVLFIRFMSDPDDFWFEHLRTEGEWLYDRTFVDLQTPMDVLRTFQGHFRGVVVYDNQVAATSNLASTIAGVEDRICLRLDMGEGSFYRELMDSGLPFTKDVLRLYRGDELKPEPLFTGQGVIEGTGLASTGSPKCDAYLWAKHHYLDKGRCGRDYMAFYIDAYWLQHPTVAGLSNATLSNHDFFISHKAFFFDLHVWDDEAPIDDPQQEPGADVETLGSILKSMYAQAGGKIIHIGGFTPWAWKYTSEGIAGGQHGAVDTEWQYARIISAYNGIMDADALGLSGMSNASFYQHRPLREIYPQNPKPTLETLKAAGYLDANGKPAEKVFVCFYMGDYDAAAWLNSQVPRWWADPAHGVIPCAWAFNPNLDRRAPHAMHYVRTRQTPNDWFIFGDSGSGYLNPGMLEEPRSISGLPDGLDAWVTHNLPYAHRYDLSITGFIIDGHSPAMSERGLDAYARFSPDGIVGQKIPVMGVHRQNMPYTRMAMDLDGSPERAGEILAGLAGVNQPRFLFVRTILKSPSWHRDTMEHAGRLAPELAFVDPYSFFMLLKVHVETDELSHADSFTEAVSFTAPSEREGLAPIRVQDGPFDSGDIDGVPVLQQTAPDKAIQYLYFEVSERFAKSFQMTPGQCAEVVVTLYDAQPATVGLHYNTHGEGDYASAGSVAIDGTGAWREVTFQMQDARFAHAQNGGASFRLVNHGGELQVSRVRVRHAEKAD